MEKKNQRNPFISGGVLVNDSDYFEKDEVNMSNDSLKASLALVNKIRQQKKAEIDNATYLKEVSTSKEVDTNNAKQFDMPKEVAQIKNNIPVYKTQVSENIDTPFNFEAVNQNQSSPGISLADLDKDNQSELTYPKDEYLPDYRNIDPEYTSPLQNNYNNTYSQELAPINNTTPVYVEESSNPDMQYPQEFTFNEDQHNPNKKPKYKVLDKKVGKDGKIRQPQGTSSKEEIKAGRGVAWLAYILFFIPLLLNGKNSFVRWHANEGLELNLLDILGAGLLVSGWLLKSENIVLSTVYLAMVTVGAIIIALTTFTKLIMIIFCLSGKEARNPWGLRRYRIIK